MSSIKERNTKKLSILQQAIRLYKKQGLIILTYAILLYLVRKYLEFLNKRKLPTSERYLVKEINNSKMYLDVTDQGLSQDLIVDGVRESYFLETVKNEVKEDDIVVDIGANIGYYALLQARIAGERGKVYAIEPVPENIELLRRNIRLNEYSNVEVYQLAIGDKNGFATIYVPKERNRSSMRQPTSYIESGTVEEINVEIITLDDFLKGKLYPDIIRMDVEGYEYQIIKGMKKILEKQLPLTLFMEFHFEALQREESIEILQTLKEAAFEIADVTFELGIRGFSHHRFLWRIASFLLTKRRHAPPAGHLDLSINEIISNAVILDGHWGPLGICFKRTASTPEDQSNEGGA